VIFAPRLEEANLMNDSNPLQLLRTSYDDFVACVVSLPEARFLETMDGWAPRDVVAHLIAWNRFMIQASKSILVGEVPAYYVDAPNDYSNINAAFVQHHSSRSRALLLEQLSSSKQEFDDFITRLPIPELSANHGVAHYSGEPATVAKIIRSLASDYEYHTRQISSWAASRHKIS
jgi:hypothetical protein